MRKKAINHVLECIDIAKTLKSKDISLWLGDGTNYPGQDDMRKRKHRLEDSLKEIYDNLQNDMRILIEYKSL